MSRFELMIGLAMNFIFNALGTGIEMLQTSQCRKIRHSKGFKVAILALFLTDFWTLNSGLICRTLGMAGLPDFSEVLHDE